MKRATDGGISLSRGSENIENNVVALWRPQVFSQVTSSALEKESLRFLCCFDSSRRADKVCELVARSQIVVCLCHLHSFAASDLADSAAGELVQRQGS